MINARIKLTMEKVHIKVKMLGDFSVSYNGEVIISENNRNNKVIELLQFLLIKDGRAVRQDELINTLLSEDQHGDPFHTLKNLVYRLRKFLIASGLPPKNYIRFHRGAYSLGECLECELDIDLFENAVNNAGLDSCTKEDRLKFCKEAISLYSGEFLLKSSNTVWIMSRVIRYKEMYLNCIKTVYNILSEEKNLDSVPDIFEKALAFYPFEEEIRVLYISCLYELNRVKEAISEYDSVSALLYDELGVGPSARMLELYRKITETLNPRNASITDIRTEMNETTLEKGAYYCNYQVFTDAYRFVVRQAERSGQSAFLMLITLNENKTDQIKKTEKHKITAAFHNAIKDSLRRGDIYTRYSPSQFVILLTNIKQENCKLVSKRIEENFYRQFRGKPVTLSCKAMSAIEIDRVLR